MAKLPERARELLVSASQEPEGGRLDIHGYVDLGYVKTLEEKGYVTVSKTISVTYIRITKKGQRKLAKKVDK